MKERNHISFYGDIDLQQFGFAIRIEILNIAKCDEQYLEPNY